MERIIELLQEIKEDIDYENEGSLIDDELLDSFDILQLISALDDEFDISIPAAMIIPENFNSVEALWNMVQELMD
ncbi:MAG: acyl carrier protein [Roseburia sp.]|nr:acyl carrier protein [Roseburia sp.]